MGAVSPDDLRDVQKPLRDDLQAGLLANLAHERIGDRLPVLDPPPWEEEVFDRPPALARDQQPAIAHDHRPRLDPHLGRSGSAADGAAGGHPLVMNIARCQDSLPAL